MQRAELNDRHGDCSAQDLACGAVLLENYNMGLHIGSIFIVLASSALGVMIPLISGWARQSNGDKVSSGDPIAFGRRAGFWASLFFVAKHFGTGIIISTAFIHCTCPPFGPERDSDACTYV